MFNVILTLIMIIIRANSLVSFIVAFVLRLLRVRPPRALALAPPPPTPPPFAQIAMSDVGGFTESAAWVSCDCIATIDLQLN